ncbi:hypothetical protein ACFPPD_07565 [Cohnella suwonensis]|uniref:DUF5107 domain-containing protein n=1 Tax=Cohnella suwonensis TaxID=696072 RepID=A0ABW0LRP6_9BACL
MSVHIHESFYKDIRSVVLESSRLAVTVIPESGGKIQSIYDKFVNREYLLQSPGTSYKRSNYDTRYADGDVSGFDEAFPSIEPCFYPLAPWRGIGVPDHGEVWALPWDCHLAGESLVLSVNGVRFPYRLEKTVRFTRENTIAIAYRADNVSDFDFRFIWAPHLLLTCEENTKIVLPPSVMQVMSTCSVDNRLGRFGTVHGWPETIVEGKRYRIDAVYPKYPGKCEKYYAARKVEEGWCALHNTVSGHAVGLSYPIEKVPYLGVWEGIMDGRYVAALEPCAGDLDALDTAIQWNRAGVIPAKSSYEWHLNLTFDVVDRVGSIDRTGLILP